MLDLLVQGGMVVDGTGNSGYVADIGIEGEKIVAIAPHLDISAKQTINAEGYVVSPGFIDIHSHSDLTPFFVHHHMDSKVCQGITLEIIGNCGISCLPVNDSCRAAIKEFNGAGLELPLGDLVLQDDDVSDYQKHVAQCPHALDLGVLIGHGTLRGNVIGFEMRPPTAEELKKMGELLEKELAQGAFGMSLGLIYPPSSYGALDEFVYLAKILKKHEAILAVHMRSESTKIFEAVKEMLEVARQSKVHLEISHLKLIGKPQWGKADYLLQMIRDGQKEGLDITCDQYPYTATATNLAALVPGWAQSGGYEKMCARLADPEPKLVDDINAEMERRGGAEKVLIVSTKGTYPELDGHNLAEIAQHWKTEPALATAKLLVATGGGVPCCYFCLDEGDMLKIMAQPFVSVGTDGYSMPYDNSLFEGNPHPRNFGTFPRYLQITREYKLLPIETAIYKITGLPADILGLEHFGRIMENNFASITIFDYQKIKDESTYTDSKKRPSGIRTVIVRGTTVVEDGKRNSQKPGKVLLRN
ncbi:N-acyl-D-amino-acid deacylase family protein [Acidaminococcus timonensis]|jgi:N-acyl-D-amino-acid deacylase|uniref:N-acyl-D-amino-acid deacylase family protein n=1 Tax=Acidaminococcus timonensis TaxID=1871002 RepID=UPI003A5C54DB